MKTVIKSDENKTFYHHNTSFGWNYRITVNEDAALTCVTRYQTTGAQNSDDATITLIGYIYNPKSNENVENLFDKATHSFSEIFSGRPITTRGERSFKREVKNRIKIMEEAEDWYNYTDTINELKTLL